MKRKIKAALAVTAEGATLTASAVHSRTGKAEQIKLGATGRRFASGRPKFAYVEDPESGARWTWRESAHPGLLLYLQELLDGLHPLAVLGIATRQRTSKGGKERGKQKAAAREAWERRIEAAVDLRLMSTRAKNGHIANKVFDMAKDPVTDKGPSRAVISRYVGRRRKIKLGR